LPTIDGSVIFGVSTNCVVAENPRAAQSNTYPGLNGVEELDQGHRGRIITITGRLLGGNGAALQSAEAEIRSYNDGATHTITDNFGGIWTDAKLESFEPQGRIEASSDLNGTGFVYHRRYVVRFKTLS
jgi:hypothetical protein